MKKQRKQSTSHTRLCSSNRNPSPIFRVPVCKEQWSGFAIYCTSSEYGVEFANMMNRFHDRFFSHALIHIEKKKELGISHFDIINCAIACMLQFQHIQRPVDRTSLNILF